MIEGSPRILVTKAFLFSSIVIFLIPGAFSIRLVTLDSIQIFTTHEWWPSVPNIYFHCHGEQNVTFLPDVKKPNVLYTFKGQESWQPLLELSEKKCKRCGLYERDNIKPDDVYDEWEFCPSDFNSTDGRYVHYKENEFNATFLCLKCKNVDSGKVVSFKSESTGSKKMLTVYIILLIALVTTVCTVGVVAGYKYWQKRKREQDQARFLKLFEEGDDLDDELGLGEVI